MYSLVLLQISNIFLILHSLKQLDCIYWKLIFFLASLLENLFFSKDTSLLQSLYGLLNFEIIFSLINERFMNKSIKNGFIFDGFPRNLKQAQKLDEIMNDMNMDLDFVFHIDVDEKILTSRIENRAKQEKIIRKDDTPAILIERLKVYNKDTKPVLDYYFNQNILNVIDGMGTIDEVSFSISKLINKDFKVD